MPHRPKASRPRRSQLPLPPELIDLIAAEIESPLHLFSLACACKALYEIVVTRHITYRHVGLLQGDLARWTDLASYLDRACNVRRLHIRLPQSNGKTSTIDTVSTGATKTMACGCGFFLNPNLTSVISVMDKLEWLTIEDYTYRHGDACQTLWLNLPPTPSLLHFNLVIAVSDLQTLPGFLHLRNLRSLRLEHRGRIRPEILKPLLQWIVNNDTLEELGLRLVAFNLDLTAFLRDMTFPNLRSLSLSFEIPEGASHLASALLQRHRKIESLCWKVQCAGSIVFDCELPFLKELSGNFVDVSDILSARTDVCRPLTSIQNLVVKGHFWNNIFPSLNTSRITKLHIRDFHGVDDIYRLPKEFRELVSLRVDVSSPFWDESIGRFRTCLKPEWRDTLAPLRKLRVFSGVCFLEHPMYDSPEEAENSGRIARLANLLPALEFLDHWDTGTVIQIYRAPGDGAITWMPRSAKSIENFL